MGAITEWGRTLLPRRRETDGPALALQQNVSRLIDDFFSATPFSLLAGEGGTYMPKVDVTETDKEIRVSAELPGMTEKDIDVSVARDILTIKGEKKSEHEEKKGSYYRMERQWGSFERSIPIPEEVDSEKVDAKFSNGVLTVTMPKLKESTTNRKKIKINVH